MKRRRDACSTVKTVKRIGTHSVHRRMNRDDRELFNRRRSSSSLQAPRLETTPITYLPPGSGERDLPKQMKETLKCLELLWDANHAAS